MKLLNPSTRFNHSIYLAKEEYLMIMLIDPPQPEVSIIHIILPPI